jgi:hypothetical protein
LNADSAVHTTLLWEAALVRDGGVIVGEANDITTLRRRWRNFVYADISVMPTQRGEMPQIADLARPGDRHNAPPLADSVDVDEEREKPRSNSEIGPAARRALKSSPQRHV